MRTVILATTCAFAMGCSEPQSTDNHVAVEMNGERYDWRTNDGDCQLRNMSSSITCRLEGDLADGEDDFSLSLNVGFDEELEERTYRDDPAEAFPDVTARIWFDDSDGVGRWETDDSVGQPLIVTLDHLGRSDVEGSFDLHLTTGEGDPVLVTGTFDMILVE